MNAKQFLKSFALWFNQDLDGQKYGEWLKKKNDQEILWPTTSIN